MRTPLRHSLLAVGISVAWAAAATAVVAVCRAAARGDMPTPDDRPYSLYDLDRGAQAGALDRLQSHAGAGR
jgi:hypothetical protein